MPNVQNEGIKLVIQAAISFMAFGLGAFLIATKFDSPECLATGSGMCGAVIGYWLS